MPVCSNLSAMRTRIESYLFTAEDAEDAEKNLNHRDTETQRKRIVSHVSARLSTLFSMPLCLCGLNPPCPQCPPWLIGQIRWISNPSRSFGSNHVDFGGMIAPASDTAIRSLTLTG